MDRKRLTEDDPQAQRDSGAGMALAERQVIIICEECGKKYSVVPSRIRGSAAGFTCRRCGHQIVVSKPPEVPLVGGLRRRLELCLKMPRRPGRIGTARGCGRKW